MRAKGEGSIYYDEAADRWRGLLDLGRDGTGKRRRVKVTGRTRKEAAERLAAKRAEVDAGLLTASTMTVAQLVAEWEAKNTPNMTPRNADYLRDLGRHITAHLGAYRLADLKVHHVEEALTGMVTTKARRPLGRASVGRVRGHLRRIMKWGIGRDYLVKNVADYAELPAARAPREGRALTGDEVRRLIAAAEGHRLAPLWKVMVGLGLRPGEARGVTWDAVDFDTGTLHVLHSLKWHGDRPVLGGVKTPKSKRTLSMPTFVADALKAHRRDWLAERLAFRWPDEWSHLVFLSEEGTPLDPSNMRRTLDTVAKAAGIGHVRPYDLRHTFASLLADSGARLEDVADSLGHEGTMMARSVYVHRLTDAVDAAVAPIDRLLGAG